MHNNLYYHIGSGWLTAPLPRPPPARGAMQCWNRIYGRYPPGRGFREWTEQFHSGATPGSWEIDPGVYYSGIEAPEQCDHDGTG